MDEAAQKFSAQTKAHEEALAKQQREYEEKVKGTATTFKSE